MQRSALISVYGNTFQNVRLAEIQLFLRHLRSTGVRLEIWREFGEYLRAGGFDLDFTESCLVEHPSASSDMVLTLGGDGTLLHAVSWCRERRIPLLGVNTGHLGFLTAYSLNETHLLLSDLVQGRLVAENRTLLEVCGSSIFLQADVWPFALNEVALLKAESSSMINVHARVDGHFLADYKADGLIVSTPTGSTGYSLSSGGPILHPALGCLALTPIAPHTLSIRPIVIGAESNVELQTDSRDGSYRVSLDGRSFTMPSGSKIEVRSAATPVQIVRRVDVDFASTLRSKLHWGHN